MKKFLSTLLCFSFLLTVVGCTPTSQTVQTSQMVQTPQSPQKTYEVYDDIISQYTALLTAKHNGKELSAPNTDGMDERETAIAEALYGIVDAREDAQAVENLGYGYKDLDDNGIAELLLLTRYTSIQAIFTVSNEEPILLEANYGERSSFVFATKNRLFMTRRTVTDHIEEYTYYTCRVDGDKMAYDAVYGEIFDNEKKEIIERFQMINDKRTLIDEEAFNELYREHRKTIQMDYGHISKLIAPRTYLPLANDIANKDLPVADFSSYAAIRETYKAISTCLDEFNSYAWMNGEYDNLFAFPNDVSFEYYNRLLYAAYCDNYYVGYDEIDLNGDGLDELVLMNGDYNINAIFTQKDGVPLLLDVFRSAVCWLDDQGFIHVDCNTHYELEYSRYEFTKSGDYDLIYSILVADNGKRYLTKDGKTEQITFEKSLEIYYNDYCRYAEPFSPNEHTRSVSNLTYTPLTEPTENLIQTAKGITWHKYADMEKTTGKDFAHGNTYVTFENVTDTQMDVNFKYTFTFCYPDPDRDHYLLSDTTESSLRIIASAENGVFAFDENGIKGRFEFGQNNLWIIIEESTDQRFPVGYHCYVEYDPDKYIS